MASTSRGCSNLQYNTVKPAKPPYVPRTRSISQQRPKGIIGSGARLLGRDRSRQRQTFVYYCVEVVIFSPPRGRAKLLKAMYEAASVAKTSKHRWYIQEALLRHLSFGHYFVDLKTMQ